MNKRIFMLGDSHIWGTEHTAPDGKICEYPPKRFSNVELPDYASELPSETTFPYYLDDWKETINLGWPGAGIDTVKDRFIHNVFDILEPNDVVIIYLPSANRTSYGINLGTNFDDNNHSDLYLNGRTIKEYSLSSENITKVDLNWHKKFKTLVSGSTGREKNHLKTLNDMNETELKVLFNNVDTFLNLTVWNQSTRIYNVINTITTINLLANSKNNHNVFFVCDESVVDEKAIKNIKKALGDKVNETVLQWNWNRHIRKDLMQENDKELWIHKYGHFTKQAHQTFALSIKDKFSRLLNEK